MAILGMRSHHVNNRVLKSVTIASKHQFKLQLKQHVLLSAIVERLNTNNMMSNEFFYVVCANQNLKRHRSLGFICLCLP